MRTCSVELCAFNAVFDIFKSLTVEDDIVVIKDNIIKRAGKLVTIKIIGSSTWGKESKPL